MDGEGIIIDRHKVKIGVLGVGGNVGTTLIAMKLAHVFAKLKKPSTYLEEKTPDAGHNISAYDYLLPDKGFRHKKLWSVNEIITAEFYSRTNIIKGVNWMLGNKETKKGFGNIHKAGASITDYTKIPGEYIIIDSPRMINHMDYLLVIIDPKPSKISAITDIFAEFHSLKGRPYPKVMWIMNKVNSHVDIKWVERYLDIKTDYFVELIDEKQLYKWEYRPESCVFSWESQELNRLVADILDKESV